jgi:hypothetical protein
MDQVAAAQDILQQLMFVNSIMAGFALSIAVQLMLTEGRKTRIRSLAAALFLVAAMLMLVAMFKATAETITLRMWTLSGTQAPSAEALRAVKSVLSGLIVPAWRIGLFAFLGGVAVVGWLYSPALGWVGLASAAAATLALLLRRP